MKERLITFTRNDKNVERVNQKSLIVFIIWAIIVMLFSNNIDAKDATFVDIIIAILLDSSLLIGITWVEVINVLSKRMAEIIEKNLIIKIVLANENAVEVMILVISMMILHFIMCVCLPGISINAFIFLVGIAIILLFTAIVAKNVSQYFEKKLNS